MRALSKSKILAFRQCPRRLWLEVKRPDLCESSADAQARFQVGERVGEIARTIYDPDGRWALIDVDSDGFDGAFARTQALLPKRRGLFEAGFKTDDGLAFTDVLRPVRRGGRPMWRMVEVKSSTTVKDYQRDDVAFQAWVAESAGLALAGISIAYIDNTWVYSGGGDYSGLLVEEDLTREAFGRGQEVAGWVTEAQTTLRRKQEPFVQTGHHCTHPYACGYIEYCRSQEEQAEFPVEWLPDVRKKALKRHIEDEAVIDLRDVPDDLLNERQRRVKTCSLSGERYFDHSGAAQRLAGHKRPAYFLDFETVMLPVPIWKGTRPYQQIPFQFSCHRLDAKGRLTHTPFLDLTGKDPSRPFVKALLNACGERGPIFVYNASFEKARMRELADRFPHDAHALLALTDRLVDLWPVAKDHYYHPDQAGSWSIKAVLPTIAPDLDYSQLEGVQDGGTAMAAYQQAIISTTSGRRRKEIHDQLLAYCERDTEALVWLWRFFTGRAPVGA